MPGPGRSIDLGRPQWHRFMRIKRLTTGKTRGKLHASIKIRLRDRPEDAGAT
jgi:hypothetical protein